jgi:hypothetical protein
MTTEPPLSASAQIYRMGVTWPQFCLLHATPWSIVWRGALRPFCCNFEVQVCYYAFAVPAVGIVPLISGDDRRIRPYVEIISPVLLARPEAAVPHTFPNRLRPAQPRLCLHLPGEWDPSMPIANTILPWTVEWLVAYEGWRATGTWWAGGHGTERRAA